MTMRIPDSTRTAREPGRRNGRRYGAWGSHIAVIITSYELTPVTIGPHFQSLDPHVRTRRELRGRHVWNWRQMRSSPQKQFFCSCSSLLFPWPRRAVSPALCPCFFDLDVPFPFSVHVALRCWIYPASSHGRRSGGGWEPAYLYADMNRLRFLAQVCFLLLYALFAFEIPLL